MPIETDIHGTPWTVSFDETVSAAFHLDGKMATAWSRIEKYPLGFHLGDLRIFQQVTTRHCCEPDRLGVFVHLSKPFAECPIAGIYLSVNRVTWAITTDDVLESPYSDPADLLPVKTFESLEEKYKAVAFCNLRITHDVAPHIRLLMSEAAILRDAGIVERYYLDFRDYEYTQALHDISVLCKLRNRPDQADTFVSLSICETSPLLPY